MIDQKPMSLDVLVADDSEEVRTEVELCLRTLNHRVRCAATGNEAIGLLRRNYFDLMVIDTFLPDGDGLEVIAEAKKRYPSTRVLVMNNGWSPLRPAYWLELAVATGAHAAISKPFTSEEFLDALREMMPDSDPSSPFPDMPRHEACAGMRS